MYRAKNGELSLKHKRLVWWGKRIRVEIKSCNIFLSLLNERELVQSKNEELSLKHKFDDKNEQNFEDKVVIL
jgi:hypothetical protein